MRSLKESFEDLGLRDVRTYINTGNVLFRAASRDPASLERTIDRMLSRAHALPAKTIVRSQAEMARLVDTIRSTWKTRPGWKYNVIFLHRELQPRRVLAAFELKPEIEHAVACAGTLLWSASLSGFSRTAMMKFGRSPFYQQATVRSTTTTAKILELMDAY